MILTQYQQDIENQVIDWSSREDIIIHPRQVGVTTILMKIAKEYMKNIPNFKIGWFVARLTNAPNIRIHFGNFGNEPIPIISYDKFKLIAYQNSTLKIISSNRPDFALGHRFDLAICENADYYNHLSQFRGILRQTMDPRCYKIIYTSNSMPGEFQELVREDKTKRNIYKK